MDVVTVRDFLSKHAPDILIPPNQAEDGIIGEIFPLEQTSLLESGANKRLLTFQKQPRFRSEEGNDLVRRKRDQSVGLLFGARLIAGNCSGPIIVNIPGLSILRLGERSVLLGCLVLGC